MPRSIEIEAETTTAAVERALATLGAGRDDVDVDILDEGRAGLMGMGARLARVRVTLRTDIAPEKDPMHDDTPDTSDITLDSDPASATDPGSAPDVSEPEAAAETPAASEEDVDTTPAAPAPPPAPRKRRRLDGKDGTLQRGRRPRRIRPQDREAPKESSTVAAKPHEREIMQERSRERTRGRAHERAGAREEAREQSRPEEDAPRPRRRERARPERDADAPKRKVNVEDFVQVPEEVAMKILEFLGCEGVAHGEAAGEVYEMEIEADDTSLLIGKRGQNLESFQYIINRICNFGRTEPTPIMLDVAGYRQRRIETLEALADSLADKAVRTSQPVPMEPLPPHERRIVHMTLRDDEDVETFSRGEGDERYLVIAPRRGR